MIGEELVPNENGDIIVLVENGFVSIVNKNGEELKKDKYRFKILGDEGDLLHKLKEIAKALGTEIDERIYLAPSDVKSRISTINREMGKLFEDYIYALLLRKYHVIRNSEIFASMSKFTGTRYYNRPDFIVEGKLAVEAKTGKFNYAQLFSYFKFFKKGVVTFPFTGECKVPPGWLCVFYTLKDSDRLYKAVDSLLKLL